MINANKVPVAQEQISRSYYKYYLQEPAEIPADKLEFLKNPIGELGAGLSLSDRNKLFDPGYLPDEVGCFPMEDGSVVVSNRTKFEGSTGEMLQWWFGWHGIDPLRYAIWDPYDHYGLEVSKEDLAHILNPNTSIPDKCRDVLHLVTESLTPGTDPTKLYIYFMDPAKMGYDKSKIFTDACSFFVCANVDIVTPDGGKLPVVMTHMARDVEGGCELRSRFWMGCHVINGGGKFLLPEGTSFPMPVAESLISHNFFEYGNLSRILPLVYAEEKDNWE